MKPIILLFAAIFGLLTFSDNNKNIEGTWLLQTNDSLCSKTVIRIQMNEGIWEGKMDIPEQEIYDKEIWSIKVDKDNVLITAFKNGSTISGKMINDSTITGQMKIDSNVDPVMLKKI